MRRALFVLALMLAPLSARAETYDYLVACANEAACQKDPVIGRYWHAPDSDNPAGSWDGSRVISGVQVYAVTGSHQQTDPDTGATYTVEDRCYYSTGGTPCPGVTAQWNAIIALSVPDPALQASPYCQLVADRELAASGAPTSQFMVFVTPTAQALIGTALISPTFAGSKYPFSGAP